MTAPAFLSSSHFYRRDNGITDVADIITNVRTALTTTNNPVWTEPSTALFKSPVDSDGRWFDILLTAIDTDTLEIRMRDKNGTTVGTRRIDIAAAGTDVIICSGENHFALLSLRATPEWAYCGMLDFSPESQLTHQGYCWMNGYRDTGGGTDGYSNFAYQYVLNLNTSSYAYAQCVETIASVATSFTAITVSGAYTFKAVFVHGIASGGAVRQFGRMFQFFLSSDGLIPGTLYDVPIDTGVTAKFTPVSTAVNNITLLVRAD